MSLADEEPLPGSGTAAVAATSTADAEPTTETPEKDPKGKKRLLFGFGKKKTDGSNPSSQQDQPSQSGSGTTGGPVADLSRDTSKMSAVSSPSMSEHASTAFPTSPGGRALSSSPRLVSPAGSQIFERDVQDSTGNVLQPNSPAIPSHIKTENHIPPVLDASSEAITDGHLDPDAVEIVTHTSHLPASAAVTGSASLGAGGGGGGDGVAGAWADELVAAGDREDSASNYGSLDGADVRRLSFISFADVVLSEHGNHGGHGHGHGGQVGSRESVHMAGLTSIPPRGINRSPSPIRSPVSSQGPGTSPPTSNPGSMKGVELSPSRKPMGSPTSGHSLSVGGDLNIETMSQALRRTGSMDMSAARSGPASPTEGTLR